MQRESQYNEVQTKDAKITLLKGSKPNYNNLEQLLDYFIEFNRKALYPIITWCIAAEMIRLIPKLKEK